MARVISPNWVNLHEAVPVYPLVALLSVHAVALVASSIFAEDPAKNLVDPSSFVITAAPVTVAEVAGKPVELGDGADRTPLNEGTI